MLMVVDVQNGFVVPSSRPVVMVVVDLVQRWLALGAPVVLTRYRNHPGSPFVRLVDWHGMHTSPDIDLVAELAPFAAEPGVYVVDKTTSTGLTDDVRRVIATERVEHLYICGIATDACVFATALDASTVAWFPV
ncbi:isochorismatase family cysteine hydrolase [Nocardia noduli]|uniref:isochorismatase family cysteine hydrolase n=1 Tax=Nocardia noduli TaxID=2815722 RepID=UPI001C21E678|nr:isochorismatase family cysteine hydrolase [Nocardia noduli]